MKCPECGLSHRSLNKAHSCLSRVENEWCHFVILCHGNPEGVTREYLASYSQPVNLEYFEAVKVRREKMVAYYADLESRLAGQ